MTTKLFHPALHGDGSSQTDGSCLCGAVRFSISGSPSVKLLCHCISCKKISGSLFQANNIYTRSQLTIPPLSAPDAIKTFVDKSCDSLNSVHRSFCAECGSRLWNKTPEHPEMVAVVIGSLNLTDEEWKEWTPEREFFSKRRSDWLGDAGAPDEGRTSEM